MRFFGPAWNGRATGTVVAAALGSALLAGCADDTVGPEAGVSVVDVQEDAVALDGRTVTVSALVERTLTETAFTIAGDDGVDELLVVHRPGAPDVIEDSGVAVTGVVRQGFDLAAVEAELGVDYDEVIFDAYDAEPYLFATAIDDTVY